MQSQQSIWPFSYNHGKPGAFNAYTVDAVRALGFAAGFATSIGDDAPGPDHFGLRRIDTKDVDV